MPRVTREILTFGASRPVEGNLSSVTAWRRQQAERFSDGHGLCNGSNPELFHRSMSMCFDGPFRGPEFVRYLLVELAPHDQGKDLAFPGREAGNGSVHGPEPKLPFMGLIASSKGALDCFDQILSGHRLQQEIFCTVFDRPDTGRDVPVAREKDDGQRMSCFLEAG